MPMIHPSPGSPPSPWPTIPPEPSTPTPALLPAAPIKGASPPEHLTIFGGARMRTLGEAHAEDEAAEQDNGDRVRKGRKRRAASSFRLPFRLRHQLSENDSPPFPSKRPKKLRLEGNDEDEELDKPNKTRAVVPGMKWPFAGRREQNSIAQDLSGSITSGVVAEDSPKTPPRTPTKSASNLGGSPEELDTPARHELAKDDVDVSPSKSEGKRKSSGKISQFFGIDAMELPSILRVSPKSSRRAS